MSRYREKIKNIRPTKEPLFTEEIIPDFGATENHHTVFLTLDISPLKKSFPKRIFLHHKNIPQKGHRTYSSESESTLGAIYNKHFENTFLNQTEKPSTHFLSVN